MEIELVWEFVNLEGEVYTPRTGHTVCIVDNNFYLFGGIDENDKQNDLYRFSIGQGKWIQQQPKGEPPSSRSGSSSLLYEGNIFVFGGYTRQNGQYFNDIYQYSPSSQTWFVVSQNSPPPRIDHSISQIKSTCIMFGGTNGLKRYDDVWQLNLENFQWQKLHVEQGPSQRFGHSGVYYQDGIAIFGGWDGSNTLNDLWKFNLTNKKWTQVPTQATVASRYRHTANVYKNSMFVFGGVDCAQERFDDLHEFNFKSEIWRRIIFQSKSPNARSFHRVSKEISVIFDGYIYIIGGFDGQRKNDMFKTSLDLIHIKSQSEQIKLANFMLSKENKPKEKLNLEVISKEQSYKQYIAIIQSLNNNKVQAITPQSEEEKLTSESVNIFYENFPKQRWFALENQGQVFSPRTGHTAVVVKNCIYLFGGMDDDGERNNQLFKYHILLNTWSLVQTTGKAPTARSGAQCIVIQSTQNDQQHEIIFFGGYLSRDVLLFNDLFSFNTLRNAWDYVVGGDSNDSGEIPQKRTDHSMVLMGNSIFVFGGRGENQIILSDLKRFNVTKQTWKNICGEGNMISGRFGHIAIGHENSMYIFGGWNGSHCIDDLYQYSIPTNIWYKVRRTSGNRPCPRYRHDATLYNDQMFVFGGVDQNQKRFNDLYSFDFNLKEWTNIITSGCNPTARTFHKLLNIENVLILLGGFDGERQNDCYVLCVEKERQDDLMSFHKFQDQQNENYPLNSHKIEQESENDLAVINMLQEQVKEISFKLQKEEERNLCQVCFSREVDAILLQCCHYVLCFICSGSLKLNLKLKEKLYTYFHLVPYLPKRNNKSGKNNFSHKVKFAGGLPQKW